VRWQLIAQSGLTSEGVLEQLKHERPQAADDAGRYAEFLAPDGTLAGPGFTDEEAATLPEQYRRPGVVVARAPAGA